MTFHVAQTAFAFLAAGAAVLIIAGLVLESLHEKEPRLRLMAEARNPPPEKPVVPTNVAATPSEIEIPDASAPFPHARGNNAGRKKKERSCGDGDRALARQRRKEQRRGRSKRERPEQDAKDGSRTAAAAETESS